MKQLLLSFLFSLLLFTSFAQGHDYISVRKKNGRVLKNFYAGSDILLQTKEGQYLQGPIKSIRNDSVFITLYDIRYFPTIYGGYLKDTVSVMVVGIAHKEISRIRLSTKQSFVNKRAGPLLVIAGAGYFTLNLLNGISYGLPITDSKNLQRVGIAGGLFGLGYLFQKLFSFDGFSNPKHRIEYIKLKIL